MKRIRLVLMVALLLTAGRANATNNCGFLGGLCCLDDIQACNSGLVCDLSNTSACMPPLVWLGGGDGGAAELVCPGTCVQPTATPTGTATPTITPTNTQTPTPTVTPTPRNLKDGDSCNDSRQCTSALCNGDVCAERNPAPAVSNHTAVFIGAALLLAGLGSVRRITRRR
jgi:hypothetical protein